MHGATIKTLNCTSNLIMSLQYRCQLSQSQPTIIGMSENI